MAQRVDLTGNVYGKLRVIGRGNDYISPAGAHLKRWACECECGNIIDVTTSQLKRGLFSCGCVSRREDLTGNIYGYLTVMHMADDYVSPKGTHMSKWHCKCQCGNELDVLGMSLKNGSCKSCGCIMHSHKQVKDLTGQQFGSLFVISKIKNIKPTKYQCICECGKNIDIYQKDLTSGRKTHCGCKTIKKFERKTRVVVPENVIGKVSGDLTVVDELPSHVTPNGSKQRIVRCHCSCGNIFDTRLTAAKKNKKCRKCLNLERRTDLSGKRFGKLTVISMAKDYYSPSGYRLSQCNCVCDCGTKCVVNMSSLVIGATRSCGCSQNTRGLLKDDENVMKKYDFEKNQNIDLATITMASNKKIWWKCEKCGRSWRAVVSSQTNKKKQHGCPYCSGRLVIKGQTDLASQRHELLLEWDYTKNEILPEEISCFSGRKVWWKCCECGHSWQATVGNRVSGSGCPKCNIENVNSFCEQAVLYYIKQLFPDAINSDKLAIGMELDIFIPSINKAIEYDGEVWHGSKHKIEIDNQKNVLCLEKGIKLIRIREPRLKEMDNCVVFIRKDSTTELSLTDVIHEVLDYLSPGNKIQVDVLRDTSLILEQYAVKKYGNSVSFLYPDIAAEWHPTKNGKLTPNKISKATNKKAWWLGKCGHEWQMSVSDRTSTYVRKDGTIKKPYGCPFCSGRRILVGYNDLQSKRPDIAAEWHPEKNGNLKPTDIMCGSGKNVWWLGRCGHEWKSTPNKRCNDNDQCPICFKKRRSPSVICIETGQVFENGTEAARYVGLKSSSTIYKCCKGESKTTGGYHWKYEELNF